MPPFNGTFSLVYTGNSLVWGLRDCLVRDAVESLLCVQLLLPISVFPVCRCLWPLTEMSSKVVRLLRPVFWIPRWNCMEGATKLREEAGPFLRDREHSWRSPISAPPTLQIPIVYPEDNWCWMWRDPWRSTVFLKRSNG